MIWDYIDVDYPPSPDEPESPGEQYVVITHSVDATIRQGGSPKRFTAHLYDKAGIEFNDIEVDWDIQLDPVLAEKIVSDIDGETIRLSALDYVELQGVIITLTATVNEISDSIEIEVIS